MKCYRATVKKVNYKKGTVKVLFDYTGKEKAALDDVCVVCGFDKSTRMPDKGAQVLVLVNNDLGDAYCLGEFYNGYGLKPKEIPTKDKWQIDGRDLTIKAKSITLKTDNGTKEF
jgi:hypothetical protein